MTDYIELSDVEPGQVYEYVYFDRARRIPTGDCLRVTRRSNVPEAGWLGQRVCPLDSEADGHEWLLHVNQLHDGRYRRRRDLEKSASSPQPKTTLNPEPRIQGCGSE